MKSPIFLIFVFVTFFFNVGYCQTSEELYNTGLSKMKKSDLNGAIKDFTMVIEKSPIDSSWASSSYIMIGEIFFTKAGKKETKEMSDEFKKALTLQSRSYVPYMLLGNFYKDSIKNAEGAEWYYHKALLADPISSADPYYLIGVYYLLKANNKNADDQSEEMDNPTPDDYYFNQGEPIIDKDPVHEGLRLLNIGINYFPKSGNLYATRGYFKRLFNMDALGSCSDFKKAIQFGNICGIDAKFYQEKCNFSR